MYQFITQCKVHYLVLMYRSLRGSFIPRLVSVRTIHTLSAKFYHVATSLSVQTTSISRLTDHNLLLSFLFMRLSQGWKNRVYFVYPLHVLWGKIALSPRIFICYLRFSHGTLWCPPCLVSFRNLRQLLQRSHSSGCFHGGLCGDLHSKLLPQLTKNRRIPFYWKRL